MPRLSVIIIAKNEAANIGACLDSVRYADEKIVVVDDLNDDGTAAIAREKGATVHAHPFCGFGPQKNFALSLAHGDWVLSLDADERVTHALAVEIRKTIEQPRADGYEIPRISSFLGREIRHCRGWSPDVVLRLFKRGRARFSDGIVHERVLCDGAVARLREPMLHHPVLRIEDALSRMDRYSTANAETTLASGKRVSFSTGILHGMFTFFRSYILRGGFRDGREGFLLAIAMAEGSYYRYMKAWLQGRSRP